MQRPINVDLIPIKCVLVRIHIDNDRADVLRAINIDPFVILVGQLWLLDFLVLSLSLSLNFGRVLHFHEYGTVIDYLEVFKSVLNGRVVHTDQFPVDSANHSVLYYLH